MFNGWDCWDNWDAYVSLPARGMSMAAQNVNKY